MSILPLFIAVPLGIGFLIPLASRRFKALPDILGNLTTFCLLVMSLSIIGSKGIYKIGGWLAPVGINLVVDGLSILMLIIIAIVSFCSTLFSIRYMELYTSKLRYYSLFLLMVAGMNGVVLTGDMFNLYVFLEIASVASYALVAFGCEHEELEAAFKYLVLGCIASCFILLGVALLYGCTGSLNMAHVSRLLAESGVNPSVIFALVCFLIGFGLKAAFVPFHAWLPDAHPSAPAPISAMLSGVLIKVLGVYALIRIAFNVLGVNQALLSVFMGLGAISMIAGVFLAIGQWDLKRLLAYHSISQIGYVILGIGIGSPLGILGGLFHLFNHSIFKSLLFLNSGSIVYSAGTRDLQKMGGLKEKMPITAATSMIASMSIAGIPPFNGFWSKLLIITACVKAGYFGYAFLAVLASILTLASFMKVQKYAFFENLPNALKKVKESPKTMCFSMLILAVLCILTAGLILPQAKSLILSPAVDALRQGAAGYAKFILGT